VTVSRLVTTPINTARVGAVFGEVFGMYNLNWWSQQTLLISVQVLEVN